MKLSDNNLYPKNGPFLALIQHYNLGREEEIVTFKSHYAGYRIW